MYFNIGDDIIDSREIIERIEELKSELESYHDDSETTLSFEYALQDIVNFPNLEEEYTEYLLLTKFAEECENFGGN